MTAVVKFGSIDLLHNVRISLTHINHEWGTPFPKVTYRGKVKLHGTNTGVQRTAEGYLVAQSRSTVLDSGHYGFPAWLRQNAAVFDKLPVCATLFGEWCGPGIQKKMALNQLDRKVYAIFMARVGEEYITEPAELQAMVGEHPDVFVLPWHIEPFTIDFAGDPDLDALNDEVTSIEKVDPFVRENFGVEGMGEGLVLYPIAVEGTGQHDRTLEQGVRDVDQWHRLAFKAKGDKHKSVRTREKVQIAPEVAASAEAFAEMVVTEGRLEQGVFEVEGEIAGLKDPKKTGPFVQWIKADVEKECQHELAASGLDPKTAMHAVQTRARNWFLGR